MPKRSDDYMAVRREEILDAVEQCCLTKGWTRLTIDDVAAKAGLSKGGVYVHFASKLDILEGLLERNMKHVEALGGISNAAEFIQAMQAAVSGLDSPSARAMAIAQSEIQMEGVRNPHLRIRIESGMRRMTEVMEGLLKRFRPDLADEDARSDALAVLFLLEGMRSYCALSEGLPSEVMRKLVKRELTALLYPPAR